jgi:hypothetical protein
MTFARAVFTAAGIWGTLVLMPLYFAFDLIGRRYPPAISHPDFYFGFVALAMAWQVGFLVIGQDPVRFHPLMVPAICEKAFYVISLAALYAQGRIEPGQLAVGAPDLVLGCLFVAAALRIRSEKAATARRIGVRYEAG